MMCGRALRAIWKFLIGPFWRPFMGTLQVALAAFLIINRSFLCSFEPRFPAPNPCNFTNLKANLEITHEIVLFGCYSMTGFLTFAFLLYGCCLGFWNERKTIGSPSEHLTSFVFGVFIVISECIKFANDIDDKNSCTPKLEKLRLGSQIFFAISNLFYVWFHTQIPLNELGEFHQSVHFSLSIYIAFHAEYREVVHIMKHIDQSHNIALSGENFLENLTVFFYALNFEFHVLLASYAYLLFRQNSLTSTSAKDLSAASTIAEVQVDRAAISTTIDTSNTEHVKPPLPPPPTFQEQLTLIKERCWQAFQVLCQKVCQFREITVQEIRLLIICLFEAALLVAAAIWYLESKEKAANFWKLDLIGWIFILLLIAMLILSVLLITCKCEFEICDDETDKHECKVLVFATVGLTLYNFCGIFVALQTITQYDEIKSKRTLTECWIALVVPVISCFETTFQTILMTRCNLHHIAMYLLFVLNGLAVINNMMEMLEAGIHSTLVTRIVNRNFLIFARALSSFGLFYRLASFFRFGHFIKNFTSEKPHVASESEGLLNPEHQQHQDD